MLLDLHMNLYFLHTFDVFCPQITVKHSYTEHVSSAIARPSGCSRLPPPRRYAYPSLRNLGSWFLDLVLRIDALNDWSKQVPLNVRIGCDVMCARASVRVCMYVVRYRLDVLIQQMHMCLHLEVYIHA
jgi:hypothetical protein